MLDATLSDFTPWWERASLGEVDQQLARLRVARYYCRGRAADLAPILDTHIQRLVLVREEMKCSDGD